MAFLVRLCSICSAKNFFAIIVVFSLVTVSWYVATLPNESSGVRKEECNTRELTRSDKSMEPSGMDVDFPEGYSPVFQDTIVHLDLKGAPPKLSYFLELFPLLSKLGATGVLIEYEDMFPYSGDLLKDLSAKNAYNESAIEKINLAAKESGLEVIPLVQTFGHLEFALKSHEHSHLREVPGQPQAICPSHNETLPLLFQMLEQVAKLHPNSKRIHIGADEVYFIARCNTCQDRMNAHLWSIPDLFMDHVSSVAKFVNDKLHKRAMMWDDEFRSIGEAQLVQSGIGNLVDLVVWNYKPFHEIDQSVWSKYLRVFQAVWAASAFKGATGSDQQLSNIRYYADNHRVWINLVSSYRDTEYYYKFKGIMLTGWSRYDHFAVLCELLPTAIPSLTVDLLLLRHGTSYKQQQLIEQEALKLLDCSGGLLFQPDQQSFDGYYSRCRFPGSDVYSAVLGFAQVRDQFAKVMNDSVVRGWLTEYNLDKGFSSPTHLDGIATELGYLQNSLELLGREVTSTFDIVYDASTVKEWLKTFVTPMTDHVVKLLKSIDSLRKRNTWPRRPLD